MLKTQWREKQVCMFLLVLNGKSSRAKLEIMHIDERKSRVLEQVQGKTPYGCDDRVSTYFWICGAHASTFKNMS